MSKRRRPSIRNCSTGNLKTCRWDPAAPTYAVIKVGDGTGGGLLKNPMPGVPSFWLAYVLVDDIGAATRKAESLGAKIVKDSIEVPDMGWLSIIADPTGAALGLWQTKHQM